LNRGIGTCQSPETTATIFCPRSTGRGELSSKNCIFVASLSHVAVFLTVSHRRSFFLLLATCTFETSYPTLAFAFASFERTDASTLTIQQTSLRHWQEHSRVTKSPYHTAARHAPASTAKQSLPLRPHAILPVQTCDPSTAHTHATHLPHPQL